MDGKILQEKQIKPFLGSIKVFVPQKRWYVIETLKSHYEHTHFSEHIQVAREVIKEKKPEYIDSFDKAMKRRWGYMFNMMIMDRNYLDMYCSWLFDILFDVFNRVDCSQYSPFEKRYVGRIGELLYNVWMIWMIENGEIEKKQIREISISVDENIFKKITAFLKAKFSNGKYKDSFDGKK